MPTKSIEFRFYTGLRRTIFRNPRLVGSWNAAGSYSDTWTEIPMREEVGDDGCPMFVGAALLDTANPATAFKWGVILDSDAGANFWGIPTEVPRIESTERHREFRVRNDAGPQVEAYYLTHCRRLGANKLFAAAGANPGIRFAVWAPNAQAVDVVFGIAASGYITDTGAGIDAAMPVIPLTRTRDDIWEGSPASSFESLMNAPYMYRIRNAQGATVYKTDIFSRSQIGKGGFDPRHDPSWPGTADTLDGGVSCSIVIDPDVVRDSFASTPAGTAPHLIPAEEFWATEFTSGRPIPTRLEDLVIYELHVGSLGFGKTQAGDLGDAVDLLDHLVDLGINAIELLPMAEFRGTASWGYGNSHHFCIESSAGGRDTYRHFVRECHRRGIVVIQDVVYNHYEDGKVDRAEKFYDSTAPEQDIYYWYEGNAASYPYPDAGYLNNGSSGRTPRFWEENVRQQFISGAAFLIEEMHVDGLRVDLTQAIHRDNTLNLQPWPAVSAANIFGQKFLRQWSRTLHAIHPKVFLIAEDHTGWDAVVKHPDQGGLGFDAKWELAFYHSLIGDSDMAGDRPRLLKRAGFGGDEPLGMDYLAGVLYNTRYRQVVFHESHDEAGNAGGTARTVSVAVNGAALFGATRIAAESRSRVCCGLSLLSAGTPMFFMAEEVAAQNLYTYSNFIAHREDIAGERAGNGGRMFRFYQDLISLGRRFRSIRTHNIDILHHSNENRVIAFKRWMADEQLIIIVSLNNSHFHDGYMIQKDSAAIPDGGWREVFNSDAAIYGGQNVGNYGAVIPSSGARIKAVVPANGLVVLARE